MKVLTCSRTFPAGHPRKGEPTYFVEKILNCYRENFQLPDSFKPWIDNYATLLKGEDYLKAVAIRDLKPHTIRNGSRFSPGEMVSLRVWQLPGGRYVKGNKQIEFAQVEVKKVWDIEISEFWFINGCIMEHEQVMELAHNDGLAYDDFISWFRIHPKKKGQVFRGQIICWSNEINY